MPLMLITRPEPDATVTAVHLRALDIDSVTVPLMVRETLPTSLPAPDGFAAMALTSANALRSLDARGAIAPYQRLKVFAVGDQTAREARILGFENVVSANGSFGDLVALIAHAGLTGPVFYPAGKDVTGDLGKSLAPFGIMVVTAKVYDMVAAPTLGDGIIADLAEGRINAALFYSRRTAQIFLDCVEGRLPSETHRSLGMLCLSESVAAPLMEARFVRIGLADYPSSEAMMSLALSFAREYNAPPG